MSNLSHSARLAMVIIHKYGSDGMPSSFLHRDAAELDCAISSRTYAALLRRLKESKLIKQNGKMKFRGRFMPTYVLTEKGKKELLFQIREIEDVLLLYKEAEEHLKDQEKAA